jgi:hypothetical protein
VDRWLDKPHAAAHVGYPDALSLDPEVRRRALKAFDMWVSRVPGGVPCGHRGKRPVYLPETLDEAVGGTHLRKAGRFPRRMAS